LGKQVKYRRAGQVLAVIVTTLYVGCFFVTLPKGTPGWIVNTSNDLRGTVFRLADDACRLVHPGMRSPDLARHGPYLVISGVVVPWIVMLLLRRGRPGDIGCRLPNVIGLRLFVLAYVAAFPFQVWMVRGSVLAEYYLHQLERTGTPIFLTYYFINMFAEHFFFHGIMLAVFRPGARWPQRPEVAPLAGGRLTAALRWLGLAQPVGEARRINRLTKWLGLPDGCLAAVLVSGLLFGAIHLGKDPRELLLSIPGGMALAYLAYRTNSWLTPFALHLATAGTALLLMRIPQ